MQLCHTSELASCREKKVMNLYNKKKNLITKTNSQLLLQFFLVINYK